ncbi:MAG: biotin/lipoyl-binding protein, partial [Polaromonas sp.]|nr:biotin/lipoyl-binding protein [Polaromonas sp.]
MPSIKLHTPQRRVMAIALAVLALTGVTAAIFGTSGTRAQSGAPGEPQATPVSVATVVQSDVSAWDEFSGRLEAVERVDIRSRVAGNILSVHFREGALVKKGDLLLTIDPAPYAADVERADAQVAAAQARVTQARGEHERS